MVRFSLKYFLVLLVSTVVLCDDSSTSADSSTSPDSGASVDSIEPQAVSFDLKKEMFNMYKGVAITQKAVTNTNVTRDQITFRMFRNHPEPKEAVLNDTNLGLLEGTKGNIVFITHGWTDQGDRPWVLRLKDSFLVTYPDWVVISVDWRKPARQPYPVSAINVYDVGNFIGDTVADLVKDHGLSISQFIFTGHSLGGQTSGFAGKRLQKKHNLKAHRIVALDPAGPLFDGRPVDKRLNPTDADVVSVIHSDGGTFGYKDPCGTIDFFPNGGSLQPGCTRIDILDPTSVIDPVVCDHTRSYLYFIEAVRQPANHLMGVNCTKWSFLQKTCDYDVQVAMGDLTTNMTGHFYLKTNKEMPYNIKETKKEIGLMDKANEITGKFTGFFKKPAAT